jgi:hypothetical protein
MQMVIDVTSPTILGRQLAMQSSENGKCRKTSSWCLATEAPTNAEMLERTVCYDGIELKACKQ